MEAIGYICQDIEPEHLEAQCNEILTAIVQGMRVEEESNGVKLAATTALLNSLEFTKANFEKETERHFIMQVVCEATQCKDVHIRVAALQCLVKIMSLYYQFMEAYMGPALFAVSLRKYCPFVPTKIFRSCKFRPQRRSSSAGRPECRNRDFADT